MWLRRQPIDIFVSQGARNHASVMLGFTWYCSCWVSLVFVGVLLLLEGPQDVTARSSSSSASSSSSFRTPSLLFGGSSTATSSTSLPRSSIPRSNRGTTTASTTNPYRPQGRGRLFPPWNLSNQIDQNGFLKQLYARIPGEWEPEVKLKTVHTIREEYDHDETNNDNARPRHPYNNNRVRIRQVPGDGNCLFHSISLCLRHAVNGTHWSMERDLDDLYQFSHELRLKAVECLNATTTSSTSRRLFLQGRETLRAHELVQAAAQQYQMTAQEYCDCMSQPSVWGGGPEIVALCNILQRPIHVYELAVSNNPKHSSSSTSSVSSLHHKFLRRHGGGDVASLSTPSSSSTVGVPCFVLRRMACFGSPKFDHKLPLHILSADSRFPDITPGQQLSAGNHFLAVFPQSPAYNQRSKKKNKTIRGGGSGYMDEDDDFDFNDDHNMMEYDELVEDNSGEVSLTGLLSQLIRSLCGWWKRALL